ncbi:MAG: ABC transporter substrate-binding protein [Actinomycetota bacterium]|nr:ABC transporter substrate-binding protein [Actinomycetota bacterium]
MPNVNEGGAQAGRGERPFDRRQFLAGAISVGAAGLVLGACSSSSAPNGSGRAPGALPSFPLGASARARSKPVPVTFWHSMTSANLTALSGLTKAFNASQHDVRVSLVNQNDYPDTLTLYTAALSGGNLPDVVQIESSDLALMIDSQSIVPAQAAVNAERYPLSDFVPSIVDYFRVDGTLWAMPFNISSQVLYYDKAAFSRAGLDPEKPPVTLQELRAASKRIVSTGTEKYGMSLKLTPSTFEEWIAMGDGTLVNHDNGRTGRATAAVFDGPLGRSLFSWWAGMIDDKLAQATPATSYDDLLAVANRISPMTMETSAALGTVVYLLNAGQYSRVKLGIGPMPGPAAQGGGVFVGGAGLYMVKRSPPERQDAAWQYIKYLVAPAQQATWAAATGYVPVRKSSVKMPAITTRWKEVPGFRVAYDQILASPADPATAGAVVGASTQVDNAVQAGLTSISSGTNPDVALAEAVRSANSAIASYNARL